MRKPALRMLPFLFAIVLVGCASATPTEAPTSLPATDTSTPAPPTATFTPAESPTPIPTANFTLADITGLWFRADPDRGDLYITINADGSYKASHGTPDGIVHSGKYTLAGRLFTFVNGWNCSPLGETAGVYLLRLAGGGKYLTFEPLDDICPDRPPVFKSLRWDRVEATPTPVP